MKRFFRGKEKSEITNAKSRKEFPVGLRLLHDPQPDTTEVDIVFIHGLTGDREETWTHKESSTFWPKELLPATIPQARVLTFGYDAYVTGWKSMVSENRIGDHAKTFLNDLASYRHLDNTNERPIIFVVHSLGGLVCEDTLLASRNSAEGREKQILECTRGIVFMGTPHAGSGLADWAEGLATFLGFVKQTNSDLLKTLKRDSEVLARINTDFHTMMKDRGNQGKKSISIICLFEELPLPCIGRPVVSKNSAILAAYTSVGIRRNHMDMTKFENDTDTGFQRISRTLQIWVRELNARLPHKNLAVTELTNDEQDCLKSLAFPEMNQRDEDVKSAFEGTCKWLIEHPRYKEWIAQPRGLLWIRGKPGAGKSTILKHVLKHHHQIESTPRNKGLIISFFFHGRGATLQRTPLGLFRSFLHQFLSHAPDVLADLVRIFKKRSETMGTSGDKWNWHPHELRDFFETSLPKMLERSPIYIFVDALDECGEEAAVTIVEEFQRQVQRLRSGSQFSICFTCRHYPILTLDHGLEICVEHENEHDIAEFVRQKLDQRGHTSRLIADTITCRASNSFQWAYLVIDIVLTLERKGKHTNVIQGEIQRIPQDLNDLYKELFESIHQDERTESLKLMRWICFSLRPLTLNELRFAMVVDATCAPKSLRMCSNTDEYAENLEIMERRLKTLSRGLAEVRELDGAQVVQFIHQTVKDFVLSDGLRLLSTTWESSDLAIGDAHHHLSRACIRYICLEEIIQSKIVEKEQMAFEYPFLKYSTVSWVAHSVQAESRGISQADLSTYFHWPSMDLVRHWTELYHVLDKDTYEYPSRGSTLLHIASTHNLKSLLPGILRELGNNSVKADSEDDYGQTPLSFAAINGHETVVKLLLARDDINTDSQDELGQTPLSFAAKKGHETVVKLLLARDDVNINSEDELGQTPLSVAARNGHETVVKLLLARDDVNTDSQDESGQTPLSFAAINGHETVVKLLLTRDDVSTDLKNRISELPLSKAVWNRHEGQWR